MNKTQLWRFFAINAVAGIAALCVGFSILCGLIIPALVWLLTLQFKWMSFNEWIGYVLLGIPIGIMAAGMMTLREWFEASEAAIARKLAISVVITTIIMWSMFAMVGVINGLFPH